MATIKGKIRVPRCWRRLIETMFEDAPDDMDESVSYVVQDTRHPVDSENSLQGDDDPEPHYDDSRCVLGRTEEGGTIELDLCSGQGNYYGGCTIHDSQGNVVYGGDIGDPLESLDDEEEFVGEDGNTYLISIEWTGSDPYENGYPSEFTVRKVKVKFEGEVDVQVPSHLSAASQVCLARAIALAQVVATTDNPDAPLDNAWEEVEDSGYHDITEADFDKAKCEGVGGAWTAEN